MVDDGQLLLVGVEISVGNEEHLEVYCGSPTTDSPCKQWYLDPNDKAIQRDGYLAIRQRNSGCLAHIKREHVEGHGIVSTGPLCPVRGIID